MSGTPGWYPDPAGTTGRFRYWDGRQWSAQTTTDPTGPAPAAGPAPTAPETGRTSGRGRLIALIAGVLVLVLAAVFGVRALLDRDDPVSGPPPPSSSVSAWDETSRPTPSPTPTPREPPPEQVACPEGDPRARDDHPSDDRVHGGDLSFPRVTGWEDDEAVGLSWAYDVAGVSDQVEPGWFSLLAVGALRMADGFEQAQSSAEMISECLATSQYYSGLSGVTRLEAGEVSVDGHPGWRIRSEITVDNPSIEAEGDVLDVIVVDTGAGESLGMFVGAVPIDDADRLEVLDETESGLTVG